MTTRTALLLAACCLSPSGPIAAQAVQAFRSAGATQDEAIERQTLQLAADLQAQLLVWRTYRAAFLSSGRTDLTSNVVLLDHVIMLAENALAEKDRPRRFSSALAPINAIAPVAEDVLKSLPAAAEAVVPPGLRERALKTQLDARTQKRIILAPPAISQYVPNVVFVLGISRVGDAGKPAVPISVATNLLGALGGGVFDAIGVPAMAAYLKDNVSVGTALHLGGVGKPSADLSLGLGEVRRKGKFAFTLWPVLGIEQVDTADARIPHTLIARDHTVASWSTAYLAVSFIGKTVEQFAKDVGEGKFSPVLTVGVRLPHHYPGSTFEALTGLFNDKVSQYRREGGLQAIVGVNIPLLKVNP